MTGAAFRKLALSMDGTVEAPHFDRAAFRVRTIFATLAADGKEAVVRVQPTSAAYELIRAQPDVFFTCGGFTALNGSTGVRLAEVATAQLRELLEAAHALASAPKRRRRR